MTTQISGDTGVSQCQPNSVSQDDLQGGVVGKGPAFAARKSANQTMATGIGTIITFDIVDFDTNNAFANSRFTPQVAGYYKVDVAFQWNSPSARASTNTNIMKNDSVIARSRSSAETTYNVIHGPSALVYMNGTTDFLEAQGSQETGAILAVVGDVNYGTRFSAYLVRAA
jgi:hypothetical protein